MPRRYVTVDVFTDRPFAGNPLAVVLDANGLESGAMAALAREFNYSETTFVLPPEDPVHAARVRIFSPRNELPFAGHPNIGTAYVLARERGISSAATLVFEEGAGLVPVCLQLDGDRVAGAELTAPEPLKLGAPARVADVAAALGLEAGDIQVVRHPPRVASVGLPFLVVELVDRAALRRACTDMAATARLLPRDGADSIYLYTRDVGAGDPACDVCARMFAPLDGIEEDPATGSATAAAAALLASLAPVATGDVRITFSQGVDMGRPSLLTGRVARGGSAGLSVHVGGRCAFVMRGTIDA
jgi:trans-2,3-dihydro-3-hydroxyanthranilate isomerase